MVVFGCMESLLWTYGETLGRSIQQEWKPKPSKKVTNPSYNVIVSSFAIVLSNVTVVHLLSPIYGSTKEGHRILL